MSNVRRRITKESFESFVKGMKAVENRIQKVAYSDVLDVGQNAVTFIRGLFPKAKKSRNTMFERGSDEPRNRGTPLWKGWRAYPTSTSGNVGFLLKHARMGQERVATVLASLDQGSKAHTIKLKRARRFRFMSGGDIIIRSAGKAGRGMIKIPARKPQPGPQGYIRPTYRYIEDQIENLRTIAAREIEQSFERKSSRQNLIENLVLKKRLNDVIGD